MVVIPEIGPWEAIVAALTVFSPNILAFIQQPKWALWKRKTAMVLYHVSVAAIYLGAAGKLDLAHLTVTASTLFTLGLASYVGLWKPVADKLEVTSTKAMFGDAAVSTPKTLSSSGTTRDIMSNSRVGNEY